MAQSKVHRSDGQWRQQLTAEQYRVLRDGGTEAAFSGALVDHHQPGRYLCAGCQQVLFASSAKFNSHSGWPSFTQPHGAAAIVEHADTSLAMRRVEVVCSRCDGHLGHVFADGPAPGGLRYCINSASLTFEADSGGPT